MHDQQIGSLVLVNTLKKKMKQHIRCHQIILRGKKTQPKTTRSAFPSSQTGSAGSLPRARTCAAARGLNRQTDIWVCQGHLFSHPLLVHTGRVTMATSLAPSPDELPAESSQRSRPLSSCAPTCRHGRQKLSPQVAMCALRILYGLQRTLHFR